MTEYERIEWAKDVYREAKREAWRQYCATVKGAKEVRDATIVNAKRRAGVPVVVDQHLAPST